MLQTIIDAAGFVPIELCGIIHEYAHTISYVIGGDDEKCQILPISQFDIDDKVVVAEDGCYIKIVDEQIWFKRDGGHSGIALPKHKWDCIKHVVVPLTKIDVNLYVMIDIGPQYYNVRIIDLNSGEIFLKKIYLIADGSTMSKDPMIREFLRNRRLNYIEPYTHKPCDVDYMLFPQIVIDATDKICIVTNTDVYPVYQFYD